MNSSGGRITDSSGYFLPIAASDVGVCILTCDRTVVGYELQPHIASALEPYDDCGGRVLRRLSQNEHLLSMSCGMNSLLMILHDRPPSVSHILTLSGSFGTSASNGDALQKICADAGAGVSNYISCSCGDEHALVLSQDGTVYGIGSNLCGQLGRSLLGSYWSSLSEIPWLRRQGIVVIAIAAGSRYSVVLSADGDVYCFGAGKSGTPSGPIKLGGFPEFDRLYCHGEVTIVVSTLRSKVFGWTNPLVSQLDGEPVPPTRVFDENDLRVFSKTSKEVVSAVCAGKYGVVLSTTSNDIFVGGLPTPELQALITHRSSASSAVLSRRLLAKRFLNVSRDDATKRDPFGSNRFIEISLSYKAPIQFIGMCRDVVWLVLCTGEAMRWVPQDSKDPELMSNLLGMSSIHVSPMCTDTCLCVSVEQSDFGCSVGNHTDDVRVQLEREPKAISGRTIHEEELQLEQSSAEHVRYDVCQQFEELVDLDCSEDSRRDVWDKLERSLSSMGDNMNSICDVDVERCPTDVRVQLSANAYIVEDDFGNLWHRDVSQNLESFHTKLRLVLSMFHPSAETAKYLRQFRIDRNRCCCDFYLGKGVLCSLSEFVMASDGFHCYGLLRHMMSIVQHLERNRLFPVSVSPELFCVIDSRLYLLVPPRFIYAGEVCEGAPFCFRYGIMLVAFHIISGGVFPRRERWADTFWKVVEEQARNAQIGDGSFRDVMTELSTCIASKLVAPCDEFGRGLLYGNGIRSPVSVYDHIDKLSKKLLSTVSGEAADPGDQLSSEGNRISALVETAVARMGRMMRKNSVSLKSIEKKVDKIDSQLEKLYQLQCVQFKTIVNLEEISTPRIFCVFPCPSDKSWSRVKTWGKDTFRLHLLCERPWGDGLHFLDAPGYKIRQPRATFQKMAPLIRVGIKLMAVATRVAAVSAGVPGILPPDWTEAILESTDRARRVLRSFRHRLLDDLGSSDGLIEDGDQASTQSGVKKKRRGFSLLRKRKKKGPQENEERSASTIAEVKRGESLRDAKADKFQIAVGECLRNLEEFLNEVDPPGASIHRFCALERIVLDDGEILWLCPTHADNLRGFLFAGKSRGVEVLPNVTDDRSSRCTESAAIQRWLASRHNAEHTPGYAEASSTAHMSSSESSDGSVDSS